MGGRQQLRFAAAAFIAGLAWGYLRHRRQPQAPTFALLQALEWFVAYGGAAAMIERARDLLEEPDESKADSIGRVTRIRQSVTERTGTEG